jgi:hypothetical protein
MNADSSIPRTVRLAVLLAIVVAVALARASGTSVLYASSTLDRPADPVVLTGADVPTLNGLAPGDVVAFKYDGGWQQIPVQVDERAVVNLGDVYDGAFAGIDVLTYTDAGTFTGSDPDPAVDPNDEIVIMAKDAGNDPPSFAEPAGVVSASGVRLLVEDPLAPSESGVVFLFEQNGSLDPSAGQQYVDYHFNLLSGDYKTTYNRTDGPNPENSTVTSPYYAHHFSDRWVSDELHIFDAGATGADILDRHKAMFAPGQCVRSEDTFIDAEGAFIVNKSGPVRGIRAYIGANSGPLTERDHFFYERRQDIETNLRVHAIPSVMDFFDYSPAATGMTYYNDLNPLGVVVDGNPETPAAGAIAWEMITGPQGSLTMAGSVETNILGFGYTSYYLDDTTPPVTQCTGDAFAYGSSGVWVTTAVPCTDPLFSTSGCTSYLRTWRHMYYDGPVAPTALAAQHQSEAATPLAVTAAPWFEATGDPDADGIISASDNCPTRANAPQANNDRNFIEMAPLGFDDVTLAASDNLGDACDADDDNDGLADTLETGGAPCTTASAATNPNAADSDGDLFTDLAECALGSDPANVASKPAATAFPDADADGVPDAYDVDDASNDADADGIADRLEFRYYGTATLSGDDDNDGCADSVEIASINGDAKVSSIDLSQVAQQFGSYTLPAAPHLANMDVNKDAKLSSIDLSFIAQRFASCP